MRSHLRPIWGYARPCEAISYQRPWFYSIWRIIIFDAVRGRNDLKLIEVVKDTVAFRLIFVFQVLLWFSISTWFPQNISTHGSKVWLNAMEVHIVWKSLKMSHLQIWHFPPIFVLLKLTLFDRNFQVFKNSSKLTTLAIFAFLNILAILTIFGYFGYFG